MGNIGINTQRHTPVSRPSVVRLMMNGGVENGAGTTPALQVGQHQKGSSLTMRSFSMYNLAKPEQNGMQPTVTSGARLATFGGLNAANGAQLGNKAVFNLYEMVALMITLSNDLNKTYREQMAARVVGEISKLHDEARTLTNAATTTRTMGIASAAAGVAVAAVSVGSTFAMAGTAKSAKAASGVDVAMAEFKSAQNDVKDLQGLTKAKDSLSSETAEQFDDILRETFGKDNKGNDLKEFEGIPKGEFEKALEQKTTDILKFQDNKKEIESLNKELGVGEELQQQQQQQVNQDAEIKEVDKEEDHDAARFIDEEELEQLDNNGDKDEIKADDKVAENKENKDEVKADKDEEIKENKDEIKADKDEEIKENKDEVKDEEKKPEAKEEPKESMTEIERQKKVARRDRLVQENKELDAKYDITNKYGKDDPAKAYQDELHAMFEGKEFKPVGEEAKQPVADKVVDKPLEQELDDLKDVKKDFSGEKQVDEDFENKLEAALKKDDVANKAGDESKEEIKIHEKKDAENVVGDEGNKLKQDEDGNPLDLSTMEDEPVDKVEAKYIGSKEEDVSEFRNQIKEAKAKDNAELQDLVNDIEEPVEIDVGKEQPKADVGRGRPKASFAKRVENQKSMWHPRDRRALKNAGSKWLQRQDGLLRGNVRGRENKFTMARDNLKTAEELYRTQLEGSNAYVFSQVMGTVGQGLAPVLQLLTSGAGVNELASAETKSLQADERADSYNASEMQSLRDGLKGIVDGALQMASTAVSSYAQFQNTVNANFRA